MRLCQKFGVENYMDMTEEHEQYCADYYEEMVEPFTTKDRWWNLWQYSHTWRRIFSHFSNIELISVGSCERVDQPHPTCTSRFILQHGKHVIEDIQPKFYEDATINLGCASAMISKLAPPSVRTLELSMANMDNFYQTSTAHRLLDSVYKYTNKAAQVLNVTRLSLDIRGVAGTHGGEFQHNQTGSWSAVRFWQMTLTNMRHLEHLELRNSMTDDDELKFDLLSRFQSDPKEWILDRILPDITLDRLVTLRICDLVFDKATMQKTLSGDWPKLEKLILDRVKIMIRGGPDENVPYPYFVEHLSGYSWVEICRILIEKQPGLCIELNQASSSDDTTERSRIESSYEEELKAIPGVVLSGIKQQA